MLGVTNAKLIFHEIFPAEYFELNITGNLKIEAKDKITVSSPSNLFYLTHEMAHVIETPNARLFQNNFGLNWQEAELVANVLQPKKYKTEVPFHRELRVFGIQEALYRFIRNKFKPKDKLNINQSAKKTLIGDDAESAFICESLQGKGRIAVLRHIDYKLWKCRNYYTTEKIREIVNRKINYINSSRIPS